LIPKDVFGLSVGQRNCLPAHQDSTEPFCFWGDVRQVDVSWGDVRQVDVSWIDVRQVDVSWIDVSWIDVRWIDARWIDA
jgi:hypothetical protein